MKDYKITKLKDSTGRSRGQALVLLLVFTSVAIITTSAAVTMTIINSQAASKFSQGQNALSLAEAGVEDAIIRVLRNPSYTGVEILNINSSIITVTVSGLVTKTIISKSQDGNLIRNIQVDVSLNNNVVNITSWQEVD